MSDDEATAIFNTRREDLLKRNLSNTENYDKAILTLSSASLGLSLTAIKFVVPLGNAEYFWLLYSNWALLTLSILSSLLAYLIGNKAIEKELSKAHDYYKKGDEDAFDQKNGYIKFNKFLNYFTGLVFSASIILIILFVTLNMEITNMTENNKTFKIKTMMDDDSNTGKKSADIPEMERLPTSPSPHKEQNEEDD
tara:strand:- start:784 stop:1368 length:585 start_codon:yes stop_codon:yes gene_type:complete